MAFASTFGGACTLKPVASARFLSPRDEPKWRCQQRPIRANLMQPCRWLRRVVRCCQSVYRGKLSSRGSVSAVNEAWPRPHRLSVDDYHRMAEVGVLAPDARVELIEGGIVDMAPIGSRHAYAVDLLAERLIVALAGAAIVRVQGPIRLGARSEPQPDLAVLKNRGGRYADSHPEAADVLLVIEVSDTTLQFDSGVKGRLYALHGIPEFWLVDLDSGELRISTKPGADGYGAVEARAAGIVAIAALGRSVDLSGLLPPLDSRPASS